MGDSNPCFRRLIQRLGAAIRGGDLTVATLRPGVSFSAANWVSSILKTGMSGWVRVEAARGHDDLVIATALAVLAADLAPRKSWRWARENGRAAPEILDCMVAKSLTCDFLGPASSPSHAEL